MAEEDKGSKTEQPTQKRKSDFRKKGDIAQSKDFGAAVVLLLVASTLLVTGSLTFSILKGYFHTTLGTLEERSIAQGFQSGLLSFLKSVAPVFVVSVLAAVLVTWVQTRGKITWSKLKVDFSRFNPLSRLKQMLFSRDSFVRLLKELLKVLLIVAVSFLYLKSRQGTIVSLSQSSYSLGLAKVAQLMGGLFVRITPLILLIGVGDYLWEWHKLHEKMKMSKQEIKDEHKEQEGNPMLKSKLRARQRAIVMNKMMQKLPEADLLLVNPTHYAIAIKYDTSKAPAPYVLAKGRGALAKKIRRKAREIGLSIVTNKPLARLMYYQVKVGSLIPPSTYKAVALILAGIFRSRRTRN